MSWFSRSPKKREDSSAPPVPPRPSQTAQPFPQGKYVIRVPPPSSDEIVCPFCMKRFPVWELEFRSTSPIDMDGQGFGTETDDKYVEFCEAIGRPTQNQEQNAVLNISDMEKVKEVRLWDQEWIPNIPDNWTRIAKKPIWQVRDKFDNISNKRICPECHNHLPEEIGRCPNFIISMMGDTFSGKSVYLKRLLLSLLNNGFLPGWELTVTVTYTDPNEANESRPAIKRELESIFKPRNEDSDTGKLPAATPIKYHYPIILELKKGAEKRLVTLFDFPGELIWRLRGDEELFHKKLMNRLNENASGWLFLLDSTTLDPVRQLVLRNNDEAYLSQEGTGDPTLNADPESVLMEFSDIFGAGNPIKTPVALVLSKADMIARYSEQLEEAGYAISKNSPFLSYTPKTGRARVDLDDLWKCHRAIEEFLAGNQVLTAARNLCLQYAWFTASSTGVPIKAGQISGATAPAMRVVEPLEWLLWVLGAYAGEYSGQNRQLWGIPTTQDAGREP